MATTGIEKLGGTYKYFISESSTSDPPSEAYTLRRSGVISAALID